MVAAFLQPDRVEAELRLAVGRRCAGRRCQQLGAEADPQRGHLAGDRVGDRRRGHTDRRVVVDGVGEAAEHDQPIHRVERELLRRREADVEIAAELAQRGAEEADSLVRIELDHEHAHPGSITGPEAPSKSNYHRSHHGLY